MTFPTTGAVHILGSQMGRTDLAALRRSIGHVNPRHRLQYSLTVREVVLTGITATIDLSMRWTPSPAESERADAMIAAVGMTRNADDVWPSRRASNCSRPSTPWTARTPMSPRSW